MAVTCCLYPLPFRFSRQNYTSSVMLPNFSRHWRFLSCIRYARTAKDNNRIGRRNNLCFVSYVCSDNIRNVQVPPYIPTDGWTTGWKDYKTDRPRDGGTAIPHTKRLHISYNIYRALHSMVAQNTEQPQTTPPALKNRFAPHSHLAECRNKLPKKADFSRPCAEWGI